MGILNFFIPPEIPDSNTSKTGLTTSSTEYVENHSSKNDDDSGHFELVNKDYEIFLSKILRFCLYQERSTYETQSKLYELECPEGVIPKIIDFLIAERYINDIRFAHEYAHGKFILKKWGRIKIKNGLASHRIPVSLISQTINETVSEEAYQEIITKLAQTKWREHGKKNNLSTKASIARYLQQKGYEWETVLETLKAIGLD